MYPLPAALVETVRQEVAMPPSFVRAEMQQTWEVYSSRPVTMAERVVFLDTVTLLEERMYERADVQFTVKPVIVMCLWLDSLHLRVIDVAVRLMTWIDWGGLGAAKSLWHH